MLITRQTPNTDITWSLSNKVFSVMNLGKVKIPKIFRSVTSGYSNKTARLLSTEVTSRPTCVDFWYQIIGNAECDLEVRTVGRNGIISIPYMVRNKDYGSEWLQAEVEVASTSVDYFRIAFEGHVRNNWQGYIALDDVKIENRACRPSGYCTFESTPILCTWYNVAGNRSAQFRLGWVPLIALCARKMTTSTGRMARARCLSSDWALPSTILSGTKTDTSYSSVGFAIAIDLCWIVGVKRAYELQIWSHLESKAIK